MFSLSKSKQSRENQLDTISPQAQIFKRIMENALAQGAKEVHIIPSHHNPPLKISQISAEALADMEITGYSYDSKSIGVYYLIEGERAEQMRLPFYAYEDLASYIKQMGVIDDTLQVEHLNTEAGEDTIIIKIGMNE